MVSVKKIMQFAIIDFFFKNNYVFSLYQLIYLIIVRIEVLLRYCY